MSNCSNCKKDHSVETVPFVVFESSMSRAERQIKRLWIALLVSVFLVFASNAGWLLYESQFETFYYEQDGEGQNNINLGNQGDVLNGAESNVQEEKEEGQWN